MTHSSVDLYTEYRLRFWTPRGETTNFQLQTSLVGMFLICSLACAGCSYCTLTVHVVYFAISNLVVKILIFRNIDKMLLAYSRSGECRVSKYEHRGLNTVHVIMLIYCTAGQYSVTAPPGAGQFPIVFGYSFLSDTYPDVS